MNICILESKKLRYQFQSTGISLNVKGEGGLGPIVMKKSIKVMREFLKPSLTSCTGVSHSRIREEWRRNRRIIINVSSSLFSVWLIVWLSFENLVPFLGVESQNFSMLSILLNVCYNAHFRV